MKVIFLDIDEVLCGLFSALTNSSNTPHFNTDDLNVNHFNLESLRLLAKLVELSEAKVVLSSTWRLNIDSVEDMIRLEDLIGVELFGLTGYDSTGFRGHEIQDFLNSHPLITNYCIIDDSNDFHKHQLGHLVQPLGYRGFIMDDFLKACEVLGVVDAKVAALNEMKQHVDSISPNLTHSE